MSFFDNNPKANPEWCTHPNLQFNDTETEISCTDCEKRWEVGVVIDYGLSATWNNGCDHDLIRVNEDEFRVSHEGIPDSVVERVLWYCPVCDTYLDGDKKIVKEVS